MTKDGKVDVLGVIDVLEVLEDVCEGMGLFGVGLVVWEEVFEWLMRC